MKRLSLYILALFISTAHLYAANLSSRALPLITKNHAFSDAGLIATIAAPACISAYIGKHAAQHNYFADGNLIDNKFHSFILRGFALGALASVLYTAYNWQFNPDNTIRTQSGYIAIAAAIFGLGGYWALKTKPQGPWKDTVIGLKDLSYANYQSGNALFK